MRVLITGATGFLGTRLAAALLAQDVEVRALVRATSKTEALRALGVECVLGSLNPPQRLEGAVAGMDAVVHAAGGGRGRAPAQLYADNRDTTAHLLDACRGRVSRLVLVSSLAAHGPSESGVARDPASPHAPTSHYGRSKAEAEQVVLASRQELRVTIVRPPAVYGPGDSGMLPVFRTASSGWALLPAPARGASMVHLDDCVDAIVRVLQIEHPNGRIYGLHDRIVPTAELPGLLSAAVGRPVRTVRVPAAVLHTVAHVAEFAGWLRGKPATLSRDKARDLCRPWWISRDELIREELGWAPRVSIEEGFGQTARWYREEGWMS